MKTRVEYETSTFPDYTLYFFYIKKGGNSGYWIWDEDKLLLEDALKKYPKSKYEWVEITEDV